MHPAHSGTAYSEPGGAGVIQCLGKSKSISSGTTKPVPFLENREQILQGWQKLLMRNSGWLLLFPEDFPGASTSTLVCTPTECHRNATNEARPLQHFCDFHGKLLIITQIPWHGTSEHRHSYTRANP